MDKKEQTKNNIANNIASINFNAIEDIVKVEPKEDTEDTKKIASTIGKVINKVIDPMVNGYKYKNKLDRKHNFITTFKVDADLERYLINIANITLIDAVNNDNANYCLTIQDYLNDLIRADLKKRFNIPAKELDSQKWIDALNDYCNKYKMQDVKPIDPQKLKEYYDKKAKKDKNNN